MFEHFKNRNNAQEVDIDGFFEGRNVTVEQVALKKRGFFGTVGFTIGNLALLVILSMVAGILLSIYPLMAISGAIQTSEPIAEHWKNIPEDLENVEIGQRNTLYDSEGKVFAEVWSENRIILDSLDKINDNVINALIATEDKRFYEHGGFDLNGTLRSAIRRSGGGSGITQQLVKNLQFYNMAGREKQDEAIEATLERKIQELKYSIKYDETHTKEEILLSYLNTVAFGGPNTYSIEAASQYYFGKSAKDISLAESALLVGTVQNPVKYNLAAETAEEDYKERQKIVLTRMVAEEYITQAEADEAYDAELNLVFKKTSNGNCASSSYPFYCDYVMTTLKTSPKLAETQEERDAIIEKGGLQIKTHLDAKATDIANEQLKSDYGYDNRIVVPVAIVTPENGGVAVIAANRKYGTGEGATTINMAMAPAGTGSTYKLITLATALKEGYTERDLEFSSQCPLYPGKNYDSPKRGIRNSTSCELQGGTLNYKEATAYSSNTWYTTLEMKVGVEKVKEFSASVGLSAPDYITSRSLSYTLGTTENSAVSMAGAFATFSNGGVYCPPTPIADYEYADGTSPVIPDTYDPAVDSCRRVLSPNSASVVLKAMRANISGEIEDAFGVDFNTKGYDTAAKSGTNELLNSAWVHLSGNYSLFANLFDPDTLTDGIDYIKYRGYSSRWYDHASGLSGKNIMTKVLDLNGYVKPDYNNQDRSLVEVPIDKRDYFTIPSTIGMTPAEALSTMESLGIKAHVSKELANPPVGYSSGVVVEQSLRSGTQLPIGSKKEIVLTISK